MRSASGHAWAALERKKFFFEKKNQKTFTSLGRAYPERPEPIIKSFLLLFFKKEVLAFLLFAIPRKRTTCSCWPH
jgi:hypothetical protein